RPAKIRSSVDLPAPFGPISPIRSPARRSRDRSANRDRGPNDLVTPCALNNTVIQNSRRRALRASVSSLCTRRALSASISFIDCRGKVKGPWDEWFVGSNGAQFGKRAYQITCPINKGSGDVIASFLITTAAASSRPTAATPRATTATLLARSRLIDGQ